MKKRISLLLAIIMMFGLVTEPKMITACAQAYNDVNENDDCYEAVSILSKLDIISGFDDGSFKPGENVTRAQMAKLIVEARSEHTQVSSKVKFKDVSSSHWAKNYIIRGVYDGFISGYDDTHFGPEDGVTYIQAMKMLVAAIGYDSYARDKGGWPNGYKKYGNMLGIGNNVYASDDTTLDRAQVSIMIYNAMKAPVCVDNNDDICNETSIDINIKNGKGEDYQTLFTKCHRVYTVDGYLKNNKSFIITSSENYNNKYYENGSDEEITFPTNYSWDNGYKPTENEYVNGLVGCSGTVYINKDPMLGNNILYMIVNGSSSVGNNDSTSKPKATRKPTPKPTKTPTPKPTRKPTPKPKATSKPEENQQSQTNSVVSILDMVNISDECHAIKVEKDGIFQFDNYGNSYSTVISSGLINYYFQTLLDNKYSRFTCTLFVPKGWNTDDYTTMTVKADGKTIYTSPKMTKASKPVDIDLDISGYNDFQIIMETAGSLFGGEVAFVGDGKFYKAEAYSERNNSPEKNDSQNDTKLSGPHCPNCGSYSFIQLNGGEFTCNDCGTKY